MWIDVASVLLGLIRQFSDELDCWKRSDKPKDMSGSVITSRWCSNDLLYKHDNVVMQRLSAKT